MKKLSKPVRWLLAALPVLLFLASVDVTPTWKTSVYLLTLYGRAWPAILLGAALICAALRKWILGLPARLFTALAIFFALFWLDFSYILHYRRDLTLLSITLILSAISLYVIFLLEPTVRAVVWIQQRYALLRNRYVVLLLALLAIVVAQIIFRPYYLSNARAFLLKHLFYLLLLVPLISGLIRRRTFGRSISYANGFLLVFLSAGWMMVGTAVWHQSFALVATAFYLGAWVHVYWEILTSPFVERFPEKKDVVETMQEARVAVAAMQSTVKEGGQSAGSWMGGHKRAIAYTFVALFAALGLFETIPKIYRQFFVTVTEFTPVGQVQDKTVVRITFSEEVKPLTGNIQTVDCFKISPPLAGIYRQESEKTIAFVPSDALKPSTDYKIDFDAKNLTSKSKKIQSSAHTEFHTEYFKVADVKLFYNVDIVTNQEREVTGEINFNYPVAYDELKKNLGVFKNQDAELRVELEKSNKPTRFYFKAGPIKREEKEQKINVVFGKALNCINGTVGLRDGYQQSLVLPAKVKLEVSEVKLHHEPGNTMIAILFNMPVSEEQVRRYVSVTPGIPMKIETEYCYAVLRGEFRPNVGYQVLIPAGIKANSGEVLEHEYKTAVYIKDLPPQVAFAHAGNILSLKGPKTLEVKSTNLDQVHVEIKKVFRNNLIQFLQNGGYYTPMTKQIYSGDYMIEGGEINEEVTSHINLAKFHSQPYKGLFQIQLRDPKGSSYYDYEGSYEGEGGGTRRAWYLVTDLGLIAKKSGEDLIVYVTSIENLNPVPGATVELCSTDNQVIDKQTADDTGRVVFVNWKNNEYKFEPMFLVAKKDDDFSFLQFNTAALNQSQFGIGGDAYGNDAMEAFLTPERGVYRPGETAHLTTVIRNADGSVPPVMPVRMILQDPKGTEIKRVEERYNENGVITYTVNFPGEALTGQYTAQIYRMDKAYPIGSVSMKVEEFIPDKLKVEVQVPKEPVKPGQPLVFSVLSRQMFGPPAKGNKVQTGVRFLSSRFSAKGYESYTFEDDSRSGIDDESDQGQDKLDDQGKKEYSVEVPKVEPGSALRAYIYTEVYDTGGRPVSASGFADIHVYTHYLGIKLNSALPLLTQKNVSLDFVAVTPEGKPVTVDKVQVVIKRKAWYSIFRRGSWGRSGYTSSSYEELVLSKEISIKDKTPFAFTPTSAGDYTIILVSPNGMRSSLVMHVAGVGYELMSLESPEKLKIVFDKDAYDVGETANCFVQAPFPGRLYLTVEREKVLQTFVVRVTGKEQSFSIPIEERFLPNVYVVGLLVRAPSDENKTLPMSSFGVAPLNIKSNSRRISLVWDVNTQTQSSKGIDAKVKVAGASGDADVVLSAVDQGILQITNFETPSPLSYFYRKRGLTTQTYSILNLILPDIIAKKFALGGDEGASFTRRHLNPVAAKKKKSMSIYSGLLHPDAEGNVHYHFDTTAFNGEVRLMAMAIQGRRYGSSDKKVQVADPIVLIPSFPRFMGPNDQAQIPLEVYNKTGKDGKFNLHFAIDGPVKITQDAVRSIDLPKEDQKRLIFFAEAANNAGVAKMSVKATGNGFESNVDEEVSVRPYNHLETKVQLGSLNAGETKTVKVPAGYIPFGQRVRLSMSGNPLIQYVRALDYLIGYPYGCAEQTTSRVFPLIFLKDLGFATGRFAEKANAVDLYVNEGIKRLETMRRADGLFSMWPGGNDSYTWLNQYVCHFLIMAERQGYQVPPDMLSSVYRFIDSTSVTPVNTGRLDRRSHNINEGYVDAYQLYLKALIKKPDLDSMSMMVKSRLAGLGEFDREMLSLSYSEIGDHATAKMILQPDFKSKFLYREQFGSFNSSVRNTALYLYALTQADPKSPRVFEIVDYLGSLLKDGSFGNTQENVWALLALHSVYAEFDTSLKAEILLDGKPYKTFDGKEASLTDNSLSGKTLTLHNTSDRKIYFHLMAEGTPLEKGTKSYEQGLSISRTYHDTKGNSVNLSNVQQGDLVIVTLDIKPTKNPVANVVIVDLLPGGFEVENPRLRSRGQLEFEPGYSFEPAYQDIRDDRVLLFSSTIQNEQQFSYTVRAVSAGRFTIPNAYAEAMYDPDVKAEEVESNSLTIVDNNAQ